MSPSPASIVKKLTRSAASFLKRHSGEKGVGPTFGYFTRHPVAPLNQKRLKAILEQLARLSAERGRPLRVLVLACGGGLITCAIAAQGHRALGLDFSADEIHLAQIFAAEEHLEGAFQRVDLLKEPGWESRAEQILGGKPDVITLAYALHHLEAVDAFVERLSRWLPEGAVLLINEENPESPLFRLKHQVRTLIQKDTETEWHRPYSSWKTLLERYGFKVLPNRIGLDLLPLLGRVSPARCWSLVFSARRG